jgi:hypothetical protein
VGRGGRKDARAIRYWSRSDDPVWSTVDVDADLPFADAVDRITELFGDERDAFALAPGIGVPGLDLLHHPHRTISRAHAELLEASARPARRLRGHTRRAVDVRVIDLTQSLEHTRALLTSVALLVQATNKEDPSVAIPAALRDGLVGEGLADAYFTLDGWEPVEGIGAFYRSAAGTYGARLAHGNGLDHLFRRRRGRQIEYLVAETKVCKSDRPLDTYLTRQFAEEELRLAGSESVMTPSLSTPWVVDRLHRAFISGALSRAERDAARTAATNGTLRRVVVLTPVPSTTRRRDSTLRIRTRSPLRARHDPSHLRTRSSRCGCRRRY